MAVKTNLTTTKIVGYRNTC